MNAVSPILAGDGDDAFRSTVVGASEVAALFVQHHGCTVRTLASTKNASAPAPSNTLVQVAQEVDFLITGLGD